MFDIDIVLPAIDLDDQPRFEAGEIGDEAVDQHLPAELDAELMGPET